MESDLPPLPKYLGCFKRFQRRISPRTTIIIQLVLIGFSICGCGVAVFEIFDLLALTTQVETLTNTLANEEVISVFPPNSFRSLSSSFLTFERSQFEYPIADGCGDDHLSSLYAKTGKLVTDEYPDDAPISLSFSTLANFDLQQFTLLAALFVDVISFAVLGVLLSSFAADCCRLDGETKKKFEKVSSVADISCFALGFIMMIAVVVTSTLPVHVRTEVCAQIFDLNYQYGMPEMGSESQKIYLVPAEALEDKLVRFEDLSDSLKASIEPTQLELMQDEELLHPYRLAVAEFDTFQCAPYDVMPYAIRFAISEDVDCPDGCKAKVINEVCTSTHTINNNGGLNCACSINCTQCDASHGSYCTFRGGYGEMEVANFSSCVVGETGAAHDSFPYFGCSLPPLNQINDLNDLRHPSSADCTSGASNTLGTLPGCRCELGELDCRSPDPYSNGYNDIDCTAASCAVNCSFSRCVYINNSTCTPGTRGCRCDASQRCKLPAVCNVTADTCVVEKCSQTTECTSHSHFLNGVICASTDISGGRSVESPSNFFAGATTSTFVLLAENATDISVFSGLCILPPEANCMNLSDACRFGRVDYSCSGVITIENGTSLSQVEQLIVQNLLQGLMIQVPLTLLDCFVIFAQYILLAYVFISTNHHATPPPTLPPDDARVPPDLPPTNQRVADDVNDKKKKKEKKEKKQKKNGGIDMDSFSLSAPVEGSFKHVGGHALERKSTQFQQ